jgi:hypothetical protein
MISVSLSQLLLKVIILFLEVFIDLLELAYLLYLDLEFLMSLNSIFIFQPPHAAFAAAIRVEALFCL